jgi:1-pyrroline-5-carboxylate dehydrogenase
MLTLFVYDDAQLDETLSLVERGSTSPYALTGAVFARDRPPARFHRVHAPPGLLRWAARAAGNFYVNDKPTGAVVGQQPFGGGRGSGTNDKAGSSRSREPAAVGHRRLRAR